MIDRDQPSLSSPSQMEGHARCGTVEGYAQRLFGFIVFEQVTRSRDPRLSMHKTLASSGYRDQTNTAVPACNDERLHGLGVTLHVVGRDGKPALACGVPEELFPKNTVLNKRRSVGGPAKEEQGCEEADASSRNESEDVPDARDEDPPERHTSDGPDNERAEEHEAASLMAVQSIASPKGLRFDDDRVHRAIGEAYADHAVDAPPVCLGAPYPRLHSIADTCCRLFTCIA